MPNVGSIVSSYSKHLPKKKEVQTNLTGNCNYREKETCPLAGHCQAQCIVYQATVSNKFILASQKEPLYCDSTITQTNTILRIKNVIWIVLSSLNVRLGTFSFHQIMLDFSRFVSFYWNLRKRLIGGLLTVRALSLVAEEYGWEIISRVVTVKEAEGGIEVNKDELVGFFWALLL